MTENRQLIARYLPKKHKARMNQMDTVIIRGGNSVEQSCLGNEIVGKKSIKSSEETGDEIDEFVHVILSELTHYKLPIIVKIHDADSYFVEKELFALNQLAGFENSVTKLCDFSCMDDKSRWKHMIVLRSRSVMPPLHSSRPMHHPQSLPVFDRQAVSLTTNKTNCISSHWSTLNMGKWTSFFRNRIPTPYYVRCFCRWNWQLSPWRSITTSVTAI